MTFTISVEVSHDDPLRAHEAALGICVLLSKNVRPLGETLSYPKIGVPVRPDESRESRDFRAIEKGNALTSRQEKPARLFPNQSPTLATPTNRSEEIEQHRRDYAQQ